MGLAWKAFKGFLMVLGAIVTVLFLLFAGISGASWFFGSKRVCDETIGPDLCLDLIVVQGFIRSGEKFQFKNVTDKSEVARTTTAYVGSSGLPTVKYTFFLRANPSAEDGAKDQESTPKTPKAEAEKLFAERIKRYVCSNSGKTFDPTESLNMRAFLKQGGAIEFDLGVSSLPLEHLNSAVIVSNRTGQKLLTEIFGGFHYTLGPVTITSCEDKR